MSADRPIRAVCLDLGGTVLRVEPSVGAVYSSAARKHGVDVPVDAIQTNFRVALDRSLARSRSRGHRCSDDILRDEWRTIVAESFGDVFPRSRLDVLFDELYHHFASGRAWVVAEGVAESLAYLSGLGIRLGVLSNWDSRSTVTLRDLDLERHFSFLAISHAVGFEKPHPAIFQTALRLAGTRPEETLHVGDSLEADIRPARQLGMRTLWVAPAEERARAPDAGPGVDSFADAAAAWETLLAAR